MSRQILLAAALATFAAGTNAATDEAPALTIYRASSDGLFDNGATPVADGYALVHETRSIALSGGRQTVVVGGLPSMLDAEAVAIDLGAGAHVLAQRVLSNGDGGALAAHRGEEIDVTLRNGNLLHGNLVGVDGNALIVRDAASGGIVYVREYDAIRFAKGSGLPGSTLQVALDGKAGTAAAILTYPTSGLGWRAAYSALLSDADGCRMRLESLASIANRSGRDYAGAHLKLIAGSPSITRSGGPHPVAYKSMVMMNAPVSLPEQAGLGDYRSYTIDGPLDLPDASVTQVPLYAASDLACQRRWITEFGGAWFPAKPMTQVGEDAETNAPVRSELRFTTTENLPAGALRVLIRDRDGQTEFVGEDRVADTPKGRAVPVTLGTAFDLAASRRRTAFSVDKATREMHESFRITLTNTGETARTITLREHPNRWRVWSLVSSSIKPSKQAPDLLEFEVPVQANGKTTVDYAVKYIWTTKDE